MSTLLGITAGLALATLRDETFTTRATIIVSGSDASGMSEIRGVAAQLGLNASTSNGASIPPEVIAELFTSPAVLRRIRLDSIEVNGIHTTIEKAVTPDQEPDQLTTDGFERKILSMISAAADKRTGAIYLEVKSIAPSISRQIAQRLLKVVDEHLISISSRRAFIEARLIDGAIKEQLTKMRIAQDSLSAYFKSNRIITAPQLIFEQRRLEEAAKLQSDLYASMLLTREKNFARAITGSSSLHVIEDPVDPSRHDSNRRLLITFVAALVAFILSSSHIYLLTSFRSNNIEIKYNK